MFIRNLKHKNPTYKQAIYYVFRQGVESEFEDFNYFHNMDYTEDKNEIVAQFLHNYSFKKQRKNSTSHLHEVISFHPDTSADQSSMQDLVSEYIGMRAPNNVVFARAHMEKDKHYHIHIIISKNEYHSTKCIDQSNREFKLTKKRMEASQILNHNIEDSIAYLTEDELREVLKIKQTTSRLDDISELDSLFDIQSKNTAASDRNRRGETEKMMMKRLKAQLKEKRPQSEKAMVAEKVNSAYRDADSLDSFISKLEDEKIKTYARGKRSCYGVQMKRKYRLDTLLGVGWEQRLLLTEKRLEELNQIIDSNKQKKGRGRKLD